LDADADARSYTTVVMRGAFGNAGRRWDLFWSGHVDRTRGWRKHSDARSHNVLGNVGVGLGGWGKLRLDAGSFRREQSRPGQLKGDAIIPVELYNRKVERVAATPDFRRQVLDTFFKPSLVCRFPNESELYLRSWYSEREDFKRDFDNGLQVETHTRGTGGELEWHAAPWLLVGGSLQKNRQDHRDIGFWRSSNTLVGISSTTIVSTSTWTSFSSHSYVNYGESLGAFIQTTLEYGPLTFIPSLRYDRHALFEETWNPRFALQWKAHPHWKVFANAGSSIRWPTMAIREHG